MSHWTRLLVDKGVGDRLTQREQAEFEPLNEQRQPGDHANEPHRHAGEVGKGLLQHGDLKKRDDEDDGRQIAQRVDEAPCQRRRGPRSLRRRNSDAIIQALDC